MHDPELLLFLLNFDLNGRNVTVNLGDLLGDLLDVRNKLSLCFLLFALNLILSVKLFALKQVDLGFQGCPSFLYGFHIAVDIVDSVFQLL